jgi:hypothetical protein
LKPALPHKRRFFPATVLAADHYDEYMTGGRWSWLVLMIVASAACAQPTPTTGPATLPTTNPATLPATAPALSEEQIKEYLASLSADDFRARQAAQDKLVAMGDDAKPLIAQLLLSARDDEAHSRLEAALGQIEENRVTGASLITMHMVDASPKLVFQELSRQCFAELRPFPENLWEQGAWPRVNIQVDHQPFWVAMLQIADATHADLQPFGDGARISRGNGFRLNGPSVIRGPFLIVANQIERSQTIALAQAGATHSEFSLRMMVYAEPKIRVLAHSAAVRLDEARDDQGNDLSPEVPVTSGFYNGSAGMWALLASLRYPVHPGTRIARIRGSTDFIIQTQSQKLEVPDMLNVHDLSRTVGGMPITIHELKKNGTGFDLRLAIVRDPQDPRFNYIQQNLNNQHLKLYTASGELMDLRGMSSRASNAMMEFTITFVSPRPAGGPSRLVWDIPVASKPISVPFEFTDLPMPH